MNSKIARHYICVTLYFSRHFHTLFSTSCEVGMDKATITYTASLNKLIVFHPYLTSYPGRLSAAVSA